MARSSRHAFDFIKDAFSPMVAVLTSEDAEMVSQQNDLSFVELVRPFCQLSKDGMPIIMLIKSYFFEDP